MVKHIPGFRGMLRDIVGVSWMSKPNNNKILKSFQMLITIIQSQQLI